MTFYETISSLHGDDEDKVKATILKSIFIGEEKSCSDSLIHTGFIMSLGAFNSKVEFLYDIQKNRLYHQCLSYYIIPRHIGLKMFRVSKQEKSYFTAIGECEGNPFTIHYYYYDLDEDVLTSYKKLEYKAEILCPEATAFFMLQGAEKKIKKHLNSIIGDKFTFFFTVGNMFIPTTFSFIKLYESLILVNTPLYKFHKECPSQFSFKEKSWGKMGEEYLDILDEENPGWSMGIWD